MYHLIDRLHTLYELLQDEQSKEIFQARFAMDMERSTTNLLRLASQGSYKDQPFLGWGQQQKEVLQKLNREHKKIILYGTAYAGQVIAMMLQSWHINFYGFCGRGVKNFPDGLLGKPVLSPDELVAHRDEYYYVVPAVTTEKSYSEIYKFLQEHSYPEDHILDRINAGIGDENQYFEFPELYHKGTAFIDGGCYDCGISYRFAKWCGNAYSSIIAFEPDPDNYARCCKQVQDTPLRDFQLVNAGLSSQEGMVEFNAQGTLGSCIIPARLPAELNVPQLKTENEISIRTVALDDIVGDRTVGFIKMDIEGAEFNALHGAKNIILRDKPLLAICVYHLRGDTFAIMDYLHELLPEYHFWLRHYTTGSSDTVLYASVDL